MVPLVGSSSPASSLKSVDLPPPFSPTSPMRSPSIISASISQKMAFPPKSFLTFERFTSNIICALLFRVSRYQRYNEVNLTTDAMQNREWRDDYCGGSSTRRESKQKGLTLLLTRSEERRVGKEG